MSTAPVPSTASPSTKRSPAQALLERYVTDEEVLAIQLSIVESPGLAEADFTRLCRDLDVAEPA